MFENIYFLAPSRLSLNCLILSVKLPLFATFVNCCLNYNNYLLTLSMLRYIVILLFYKSGKLNYYSLIISI